MGDETAGGAARVHGTVLLVNGERLESLSVWPHDPAAFFEGFCPNCHLPLGSVSRNRCPQCLAYWNQVRQAGAPEGVHG